MSHSSPETAIIMASGRGGTSGALDMPSESILEVMRRALEVARWHRRSLPCWSNRAGGLPVSIPGTTANPAFTGVDLRRVVEPGTIEVLVGPSAADLPLRAEFTLTGALREVGHDQVLTTPVEVEER